MIKKILLTLVVVMSITLISGCQKSDNSSKPITFTYTQNADQLAQWVPMVTPGGGEGTVTAGDTAAIVHAAADGWGGVQSQEITLDLSKNPLLFVQVKENQDGFKWGAKFVPSTPLVDGHEWGVYLIEDNNFKWNNYAVSDIKAKLGQDFIDVYGTQVKGVLWIYATGSPDATVEVTSVKILNQN